MPGKTGLFGNFTQKTSKGMKTHPLLFISNQAVF
jgi:hypothetical protein